MYFLYVWFSLLKSFSFLTNHLKPEYNDQNPNNFPKAETIPLTAAIGAATTAPMPVLARAPLTPATPAAISETFAPPDFFPYPRGSTSPALYASFYLSSYPCLGFPRTARRALEEAYRRV